MFLFRVGDNICPYNGNPELHLTATYAVKVNKGKYEDVALKRGVGALVNHKAERKIYGSLHIHSNMEECTHGSWITQSHGSSSYA